MTVKELIVALHRFDQDLEVVYHNKGGTYYWINKLEQVDLFGDLGNPGLEPDVVVLDTYVKLDVDERE